MILADGSAGNRRQVRQRANGDFVGLTAASAIEGRGLRFRKVTRLHLQPFWGSESNYTH
jgi:hypothetical protein